MGRTTTMPMLGVAPNNAPYRDLGGLIAAAKEESGGISYGAPDIASAQHLLGAIVSVRGGVEILHATCRGGAQILTDLIGGNLNSAVAAVSLAEKLAQLMDGLVVHPEIMRRNLDRSGGRAHHLLYEVAQRSVAEDVAFAAALAEHPTLDGFDVGLLLEPAAYLGEAPACVDDAVAACGQGPQEPPAQR